MSPARPIPSPSRSRKQLERPPGAWPAALLVFGLALALRLLFWQATPDSSWPHSACYRGDAVSWMQNAYAIQNGLPFEDGLPMHPPGAAYLIAALWNGRPDGVAGLKGLWCLFGAVAALLFHLAVRRSFGPFVGLVAGMLAAASTALVLLSTSLNNEMPYLLLVMASMVLWRELGTSWLAWISWAALQALACLMRVEHVLFVAAAFGLFAILWVRQSRGAQTRASRVVVRLAVGAAAFLLPLVPWQVHVWHTIRFFNQQERPSTAALPPEIRALEARLASMIWDPEAQRRRNELPGFVRRLGGDFIASTVAHRGGSTVTAGDVRILEDAFGYWPKPLSPFPFITSYGPLNFYLANNPHADGGFNRLALDDPPPLAGGANRYPSELILTPPRPGMLCIDYPPHLQAIERGYSLGWKWIREHPGRFLALVGTRLRLTWAGASMGFGGYGIPLGLSGRQRAVDLVVPDSSLPADAWQWLWLLLCGLGLLRLRGRPELLPWLLYLGSKLALVVPFYGYARVGATMAPAGFLLVALAAEDRLRPRLPASWRSGPRGRGIGWRLALIAGVCLLALEMGRNASHPALLVDGKAIRSSDPVTEEVFHDRRIEVR